MDLDTSHSLVSETFTRMMPLLGPARSCELLGECLRTAPLHLAVVQAISRAEAFVSTRPLATSGLTEPS